MEEPRTEQNLARTTARGAAWMSVAGVVTQALAIASSVLVARCLTPDQYGTAAMAMVVVALAQVFLGFGFGPAIVTGRMSGPLAIASAHWFVVAGGVVMAGVALAGAPIAAAFFENPGIIPLIAVAALIPVLGAWEVVPLAAIQASQRFERVALISIAGQATLSAAAITLALLGGGVWALIVPTVLSGVVRAAGATWNSPLALPVRFAFAEVRPFLRECAQICATVMTEFLFFNADRAVIGRMLGTDPLGRYNFANTLVSRSLFAFSRSLGQPLLTALGKVRDEAERFDRAVVRACVTVARFTFPISIGGALLAPELIHVLVGGHWDGAVTLTRIFFVLGAVQSIAQFSGSVWLARGQARLMLIWSVATNAALVGVFVLGALCGSSEAVAAAFALYSIVILTPLNVMVTRRYCRTPLRGLGGGLAAVLRDTLGMALVVACADVLLAGAGWPMAVNLVAKVLLGAAAYTAMFRLISADEMTGLLALLPAAARRIAGRALRLQPQ